MKNTGSTIASEIDIEYRMKKVYQCPRCIFYDTKDKKCKEEYCQNRSGTKHFKVGEGVKGEIL